MYYNKFLPLPNCESILPLKLSLGKELRRIRIESGVEMLQQKRDLLMGFLGSGAGGCVGWTQLPSASIGHNLIGSNSRVRLSIAVIYRLS